MTNENFSTFFFIKIFGLTFVSEKGLAPFRVFCQQLPNRGLGNGHAALASGRLDTSPLKSDTCQLRFATRQRLKAYAASRGEAACSLGGAAGLFPVFPNP